MTVEPTQMKVAIIGAGVAGLAAIKECLDQDLMPVCFEQNDKIGGIWNIYEKGPPKHLNLKAQMFANIIMINSKHMSCFSDFPFPKDFPVFTPVKKLIEYYKIYAEHFNLIPHIRLNTKVVNIRKGHLDGQWEVTYTDAETESQTKKEMFDGVLIGNGILNRQNIPTYPGQDIFEGNIEHSGNYDSSPYKDQVVVIVGSSNSAVDIAVEMSRVAKKTYLSTRSGLWVIPRMLNGQVPWDIALTNRKMFAMNSVGSILEKTGNMLLSRFDYKQYGITPKRGFLQQSMCINDEVQLRLLYGLLQAKPGIKEFNKNGVTFADDSTVDDIDTVIFATGFKSLCPFLEDKTLFPEHPRDRYLYKNIFPIILDKPTMAFIGQFYIYGAVAPTIELQSRLAVRVLQGKLNLPSRAVMKTEIDGLHEALPAQWGFKEANTIFIFQYQNDIAAMLGVKPNLTQMFFSEFSLAWQCLTGGCVPAQWRLMGPGAKKEIATKIIMGTY